ncbi:MAG: DNA repair protein RecN [Verrucomicrobia bacterium]|nr:DNA repair protein RecN [Verrucomicrobiota bacterium]
MPATLRSLRIRNLALVESLDWELTSGFNVVTGETGAGKSVILGALKLVLGERAERSLIRTGADQCSVEAVFELDEVEAMNRLLGDQGVEACEENQLLLKRIFSASGTNRQFINGSQTTLAVLKSVGDGLVDLHGPHDHQSLLSKDHQLAVIDGYGKNFRLLAEYHDVFRQIMEFKDRRNQVASDTSAQNLDLWRYQRQELKNAGLKEGELQELGARYSVISNARRLMEIAGQILSELSESDSSVINQLGDIGRSLKELERIDATTSSFVAAHQTATLELDELASSLIDYQSRLDLDPKSLEQMEERLNLLNSLIRKYHRDEAGLIELQAELATRLGDIDHREERLAQFDREIETLSAKLLALGQRLREERSRAGLILANSICNHLKDLGFAQASFEIEFQSLKELGWNGLESVDFLFAPNPGEPISPLRLIASSGEISRVMLAVKTALAQADLVGLLVFDEIDANVGGEIAHSVGAKMRALGNTRQILTITHMPQVAAAASRHFCVQKELSEGRTRTYLFEVTGERRIDELARMLGGKSKSAIGHAKELLARNHREGLS